MTVTYAWVLMVGISFIIGQSSTVNAGLRHTIFIVISVTTDNHRGVSMLFLSLQEKATKLLWNDSLGEDALGNVRLGKRQDGQKGNAFDHWSIQLEQS